MTISKILIYQHFKQLQKTKNKIQQKYRNNLT